MNSKKAFLLFGSTGALGKAAVEYFLNQEYDNYYFFARRSNQIEKKNKCVEVIQVDDLSIEENVKTAFSKVQKDSNTEYFLFSAIGAFSGGQSIAETNYQD
jgi:hypothetical protein